MLLGPTRPSVVSDHLVSNPQLAKAVAARPHGIQRVNLPGFVVPRQVSVGLAGLGTVAPRVFAPFATAVDTTAPGTRTEEEWRALEKEAVQAVELAGELIPALTKAEEKAHLARITSDIAARLAGEADGKAREAQPKAAEALEGLRKQMREWQSTSSGTSPKDLHSLAASRLAAWCAAHIDATSYQEVDSQEVGVGGLEGTVTLAAEISAAEVGGKQYAVLAIAISEEAGKGQLAGTHLHWGCTEKAGGGWKAPPAGWHTDPNVSHPKGSAWETPFALYAPKKDGQPDAASAPYVLALQLPLEKVLRGGGIEFILKRDRKPEWVSNASGKNFFISLAKAAEHFEAEKPGSPAGKLEGVQLPSDGPEWVLLDPAQGRTEPGQARSPGSLRQQLESMAQLLETPPPAVAGNGKVKELSSVLEKVADDVFIAEAAAEEAALGQEVSSSSAREVQMAEQELREAQARAESAILGARQATALLKGKDAEVSLEDLLKITRERLMDAQAVGPLSSAGNDSKEVEPVQFSARMDGLRGHVAGHAVLTKDESGKACAVVALAAGESFPDGLLQDAKVHWGTCLHEESGWERPPTGWKAFPEGSQEAGGVATETPLQRVDLPDGGSNAHLAAYAATLHLPLESGIVGALSFVLHAPAGRWVACNRNNAREDFFFGLSPLLKIVRKEQKEVAAKKSGKAANHKPAVQTSSTEDALDAAPAASQTDGLNKEGGLGASNWRGAPNQTIIEDLAAQESKAERSLMHRFNIGLATLDRGLALPSSVERQGGLAALVVWLRFSAARLLTWNRNYNIKPREISAAQERLTRQLAETLEMRPELHDLVLLAMAAVGRGGEGNQGQRIRDEILTVQSRNNAKGGMMEEWHQKLHNNSSPDDIIICQALLAYLQSDLDISKYWTVLAAGNVTKERMAGYDRSIRSEPNFEPSQQEGLITDLTAYLQTLQAVHGGADLRSAAATVMGFKQETMKGKPVAVVPVPNVATPRLQRLLDLCISQQTSPGLAGGERATSQALQIMRLLLDARLQLQPAIKAGNASCGNRLRDVMYLDLALEGTARGVIEANLANLRHAAESREGVSQVATMVMLALRMAGLSFGSNQELLLTCSSFQVALRRGMQERGGQMRAYAAAERLSRALGDISQAFVECLHPTTWALGSKLGIAAETCSLFPEEVVRGTMAAPLAQLLAILDTALRAALGLGAWRILSRVPAYDPVVGHVVQAASLAAVQYQTYDEPTLLIADCVSGEEEVPLGVVGTERAAGASRILQADCPWAGHQPELSQAPYPSWKGQLWPSRAEAFSADRVGAKSMNLTQLKGQLPDWIHLPASAALPFGTFEAVLRTI
ncbi:hypothetical protein WJX84_011575 [Apatococcus fuscideae]|uniref:Uncharacterized protein n=1 Tax=Apatococcus fuscideae TaxID=2026836 RepID=A0AAW1SUC0_9CHLO